VHGIGVGRGPGRPWPLATPLDFEKFRKKVVFGVSNGKKTNFNHFCLPPLEKTLEKCTNAPPGKILPTPVVACCV